MAHIQLPEGLPGIVGPLTFSPDTAQPLLQLAEVLLRGPNTLTSAEREMIAAQCNPDTFWGTPGGTARPTFGKICPGTSTTNVDAGGAPNGQSSLYAVGGPRSAQFTLKVVF